MDHGADLERLLGRCRAKVPSSAVAARVLLQSGLKTAATGEARTRSTLGVLMVLEWCVPTCHASFRQAVAGERWMRKLVDLCRKDATEQALVRQTIAQLIANWAAWYAGAAACAGFEGGCEMLRNQGYSLPLPASRSEMIEGGSGSAVADGTTAELPAAEPGPHGVPGLQLRLHGLTLGRADTPQYLTAPAGDTNAKVDAELEIMREDISQLEATLKQCAAGKRLSSIDRADAAQAAQDTRGWQARLSALLGRNASGAGTHRPEALSTETREQIDALLSKIDSLLHQWEEVAPVERRNRARTFTGELQAGQTPRDAETGIGSSAAAALASGSLGGVPLPAGAAARPSTASPGGGTGNGELATPRSRQLFLHNPKLLTARGPALMSARGGAVIAKPPSLAIEGGPGVPPGFKLGSPPKKLAGSPLGRRHSDTMAVAAGGGSGNGDGGAESPQMRHLDLAVSQESARARKKAAGGGDGGGLKLDLAHLDLAMPDGTAGTPGWMDDFLASDQV